MPATFVPDATEHGLSAEAQALDAARLTNEVLVAEAALELDGVAASGDDAERAKVAVARQVNLQLRVAADPDVVTEGRGRQSVTYATIGGARVVVDPLALSVAQQVRQSIGARRRAGSGATSLNRTW